MNKSNELTKHEEHLVSLLFAGMEPKVAAKHLGRSYGATKNHLYIAYRKLGVTSYQELVSTAYLRGGFNLWSVEPAPTVDSSLSTYHEPQVVPKKTREVEHCGLMLKPNEVYFCRLLYNKPSLSAAKYAKAMHVSTRTMRSAMSRIYKKAGVRSSSGLWELLYEAHTKTACGG